jgi:hypothetical protein
VGLLAIPVAALLVRAVVIYVLARGARRIEVGRSRRDTMAAAGGRVTLAAAGVEAVSDQVDTLAMTGEIRIVIEGPGQDPLVTIVARDPSQVRRRTAVIDDFLRETGGPTAVAPRGEPAAFR